MPPMLDVSDEVRAEIGDEEAARLLAGDSAPGTYDCTSCRTPGDTSMERTSTVLFVGEETAVLAFAHATCIPSQVVPVSEEQLQGAVQSIAGEETAGATAAAAPRQAVLGITCGLVLVKDEVCPALVIEPTGPIARPGDNGPDDDFLPILIEQGFLPVNDLSTPPSPLPGWSVLLAMGQLHAILQPGSAGAWWQAHQPLAVSEGWRQAVHRSNEVYVYAAPHGTIGQQPREDLLRDALERACGRGLLVAATMPLSGT
ncbi:hypothetical protein [Actinacidiphila glaucinigra]|uniref:Uncharacterized protein n=1 Tax=Actinacidiphila glaucinigra TaxID=235986 RepID=A0A239K3R0_9ACTN|nr:hypothetical protein [Actinacidiphila glaucinigra]SNT11804.1 hypothetical protein SAMN05216252_114143 [Actinacidiphila glaucinigra]